MSGTKWTYEEEQLILEAKDGKVSIKKVMDVLLRNGRTLDSIEHKLRRLGAGGLLSKKSVWDDKRNVSFMKQNYSDMPNIQIAEKLGLTLAQVACKATALGLSKSPAQVQESYKQRGIKIHQKHENRLIDSWPGYLSYEHTPFNIVDNPITIMSDIHFPVYDHVVINRMIIVSLIFGSKTLITGGDVLDSDWASVYVDKTGSTFEDELNSLENGLNVLLRTFDKIYMIEGNHEFRVKRLTNMQIKSDHLRKLLNNDDRIRISEHWFCHVDNCGVKWEIVHLDKTRKQQLSAADELSTHSLRNTIVCGDHMFNVGMSKSGNFAVAQLGYGGDKYRMRYKMIKRTTHSEWTGGFGILFNGTLFPFSMDPRLTNWEFWFDMYDAKFGKKSRSDIERTVKSKLKNKIKK